MTPTTALDKHAEAAEEAAAAMAVQQTSLSVRREMIVREFTSQYDIRKDQIFFDENGDEPYFDFEALSLLVNQLSDIPSIVVLPAMLDNATGIATATCEITLEDGKRRTYSGSSFTGETMPGGGTVKDFRQALAVAQTRALRTSLRAVSFDPMRAHEARKKGADLTLKLRDGDPRTRMLAEAHMLGADLGYIMGTDKTEWRKFIHTYTHGENDLCREARRRRARTLRHLPAQPEERTPSRGGGRRLAVVKKNGPRRLVTSARPCCFG